MFKVDFIKTYESMKLDYLNVMMAKC